MGRGLDAGEQQPDRRQGPGSTSGADYSFTTPSKKVWYEYRIDCINTSSTVADARYP